MKGLPSIGVVAELAGVSTATVSRVLNSSKPVNAQTRLRVEAVVAKLGYRPNVFGRCLARSKSHLVLVLGPDLSNPRHAQVVCGVESAATRHGYRVVLTGCTGETLDSPVFRLVDGLISLMWRGEGEELEAGLAGKPWVDCSERLSSSSALCVGIDQRQAVMDAVQYLLNIGHRRVALISGGDCQPRTQLQLDGYLGALRRTGIEPDAALIRMAAADDCESGERAAAGLLTLQRLPTAVVALSDMWAVGAIKALRRGGLRVPQDVAVVGFGDLPVAEAFEPALTTISQPLREIGEAAFQLLTERLEGESPASRTLQHRLVLRESA